MLKIQNLSVSYGLRRILHDVSLNVQSGEVLTLIGPNGAGKSTLIRAASGVIPYEGHVRTNGDDFVTLTPMQRAKYIATVPQAVSMPPAFTVWETVLLGRTPYLGFLGQPSQKDEEIARQALQRNNVYYSRARCVNPRRFFCSMSPPRTWICNIKSAYWN
jgi:iron complex transport system ATP-binding protein